MIGQIPKSLYEITYCPFSDSTESLNERCIKPKCTLIKNITGCQLLTRSIGTSTFTSNYIETNFFYLYVMENCTDSCVLHKTFTECPSDYRYK